MNAITLMYHDVVARGEDDESGFPTPDAARYKLDQDAFARHLDAIAAVVGTNPRLVTDTMANPGDPLPLLLTFDDGGVTAHTRIAPLLEARGWHGHFFVTAGRVGEPGFLNRAQIRELHDRGHVIGSHSWSHPDILSACSEDELATEWSRSIDLLSEILGQEIRVGSVPGGYFSRTVGETAARSGIRWLFNSEPVIGAQAMGSCTIMGRFSVTRDTPPDVVAGLVSGRRGPRARQYLAWNTKKILKRVGGPQYVRVRRALLARRGS